MVAELDALMDHLQAAVETLAGDLRDQDGRDEDGPGPDGQPGGSS